MISITEKKNCCGCTACASICPKNAIEMVEDDEGFLYPQVNKEKCIDCGLCDRVCNYNKEKKAEDISNNKSYICQNVDEDIRNISTSGGMFSVIANQIIESNGIIWAADFDDNLDVVHRSAKSNFEMKSMCGSKYVQSNIVRSI